MKYISFAIPSYNSQEYMAKAIESILPGKEEVEIIIVNDGSKDRTSEIAHGKVSGHCKGGRQREWRTRRRGECRFKSCNRKVF